MNQDVTTQDELLALIRSHGNPRSWHIVAKDHRAGVIKLVLCPVQTLPGSIPVTITLAETTHPFSVALVVYGECAFVSIPTAGVSVIPYEPVLSAKAWSVMHEDAAQDPLRADNNALPDMDNTVRKELEQEGLIEHGRLTARACHLLTARSAAKVQYATHFATLVGGFLETGPRNPDRWNPSPPVTPPPVEPETDATSEKKLRIPAALVQFIETEAGRRGNDFTSLAREILYLWAKTNGYDTTDRPRAWSPPRILTDSTGRPFA